jgi:hypothetical protein
MQEKGSKCRSRQKGSSTLRVPVERSFSSRFLAHTCLTSCVCKSSAKESRRVVLGSQVSQKCKYTSQLRPRQRSVVRSASYPSRDFSQNNLSWAQSQWPLQTNVREIGANARPFATALETTILTSGVPTFATSKCDQLICIFGFWYMDMSVTAPRIMAHCKPI